MPTLEIWSTTAEEAVNYVLHGFGDIQHYDDPDDDKLKSEESNDQLFRFDDGSYVLSGSTGNEYGDAYEVETLPLVFRQYSGESDFELIYDGEDVTEDLTSTQEEKTLPDFINKEKLKAWAIRNYADVGVGDGEDGGEDTQPEPEPMHLTGEFEIRSTPRTPAMRYRFEVEGEVREGASLEEKDTITDGEPTVVEGTVGPKGTDAYNITGEIVNFSATNVNTDEPVSPTAFDIAYMGERTGLWKLLGKEQPEYPDTSAESIGGGSPYSQKITEDDADIIVEDMDLSAARAALDNADTGDIVFVPGDAEIYSPRESRRLHVPDGVTFASDRGVDGSEGALFHTDAAYSYGAQGLITAQQNARVTGIRVRGPHPSPSGGWRPHSYDYEMSGIEAQERNVEVDNVEVWGFAHLVNGHTDTHCHHSHLHHANMQGLGYCMSTGGSEGALFEFNYCHHWRHVVAAGGSGGYEARDNLIDPPALAHCFDQHSPGGTYTKLHHNTYRVHTGDDVASGDPRCPFATFRGENVRKAEVYKNWSYNEWPPRDTPSTYFTDEFITKPKNGGTGWDGVEWWDNHLGTDEPASDDIGCPR